MASSICKRYSELFPLYHDQEHYGRTEPGLRKGIEKYLRAIVAQLKRTHATSTYLPDPLMGEPPTYNLFFFNPCLEHIMTEMIGEDDMDLRGSSTEEYRTRIVNLLHSFFHEIAQVIRLL